MEMKEVFEPIISFMKNIPKKEKDISKQAAKDRLKLVLMQDRASVSPDFFEMMKKEIIDVIKKYIEIDEESLEVQLTRGYEAGLEGPALYANIPIKNIKPVASNGETTEMSEAELSDIADSIADEILDEASKKMEDTSAIVNDITATIEEEEAEENTEEVAEEVMEEPKSADIIAENVSKEMKKSAAKAAAMAATRKTVKRVNTAQSTAKKTSRKKVEK